MKVTELLENYDFYKKSNTKVQEYLVRSSHLIKIDPGETLLDESYNCSRLLLIGSGQVRVYINGENGREVTLYHIRAGESCIINILSAIVGMEWSINAVAVQPVVAVAIDAGDFRALVNTSNELRNFIFDMMTQRIAQMLSLIEQITFARMEHRVAEFLMQQFGNEGNRREVISITHADIASELGSAREVITRLLRKFCQTGAIEIGRGKIRLLDESALSECFRSL